MFHHRAGISVGLMLIPVIKYLGLFLLFLMVIFFVILVKQAWNGKYHVELKDICGDFSPHWNMGREYL